MNRVLPILFNGDMVFATLDGRKTVTRRKVDIDIANQFDVEHDRKTVVAYIDPATGDSYDPTEICRYQPGDILYVRETWAHVPCIDCRADEQGQCHESPIIYKDRYSISEGCFIYRADYPEQDRKRVCWKPSIHMPKRATRIWLKTTDVRVERLQTMALDDFLAEGVTVRPEAFNDPGNAYLQAKKEFSTIWDSTIKQVDYGKYSWNANPWTWVIEFERCWKPEGTA